MQDTTLSKLIVSIVSLILMLILLPILGNESVQAFFKAQSDDGVTMITILVYSIHIVQILIPIILLRLLKIDTNFRFLIAAEIGWFMVWFVFLLSEGIENFGLFHGYVVYLTLNISPLIFSYTFVQIVSAWSVK